MKIIKSYCTKSDCYKAGRTIKVKGLMLHSVGCSQPDGKVFINTWNKPGANACPHAVLDAKGNVYQALPWSRRGWHGGGSSNDTHIGVEMTEPSTIKYIGGSVWKEKSDGKNTKKHVMATYKTAVELFAKLCREYKLNPLKDGVIVSHSEGHKRGIATNHGDVEHIWKKFGLTMNQFRKDVKKKMGGSTSKKETKKPTKKTSEFKVKVSISKLNIRKGPGTNFAKTGKYTGKGSFTITKTKAGQGSKKGWGYLKNGKGWISLDYCKKI